MPLSSATEGHDPTKTTVATATQHDDIADQIAPATAVPSASGSVLIQIGFLPRYLPYSWIAQHYGSIAQITKYVPLNLAEALGVPESDTPLVSIDAWKQYNQALVRCYIPGKQLKSLKDQIHSYASPLFNSKEEPARALFQYLDPDVPLIPGQGGTPPADVGSGQYGPGSPGQGKGHPGSNGGGGDASGTGDGGSAGPAGSDQTSSVHPKSVGIGIGVVAGAALYGFAMFWVARRRRAARRPDSAGTQGSQPGSGHPGSLSAEEGCGATPSAPTTPSHNRVSSVTGRPYTDETPEMSMLSEGGVYAYYGPPPSVIDEPRHSRVSSRMTPAQISAPVMTENSLGWT
ncbi:hypothetical protein KEM52_005262 [Ascosphaera acerosa]|nr:hypothetical protein KEM52_005262 [Ascosphaera acerosa]